MFESIERLVDADSKLPSYYNKVWKRWTDVLKDCDYSDLDSLANRLHLEVHGFEDDCESQSLGKEVMAIVGIVRFHSNRVGFEHNEKRARFVFDAILRSSCPSEVKHAAKQVASLYGLDSHP